MNRDDYSALRAPFLIGKSQMAPVGWAARLVTLFSNAIYST